MPPEADVILIEDNNNIIEFTVGRLAGHTVVAVLKDTDSVDNFLQQPLANPLKTVFVVDGTLENRSKPGADGKESLRMIREKYPDKPPYVIGRALNTPVEGADIQCTKEDFGPRALAQEITNL